MNPAPILLVHDGPTEVRDLVRRLVTTTPHRAFTDRAGQQQRLWRIDAPADVALVNDRLAGASVLIADGHHRYAAYLRLQHEHPGTGWDSGLAMLVDQGDTGLFLGAIHRTLRGVGLDDLLTAARAAGATTRSLQAGTALIALAPGTLTATDGDAWAAIDVPDRGLLPVEWLHRDLVPTLPSPQVAYHHSVEEALALAGRTAVGGAAACAGLRRRRARHQPGSPPPREGHVLPAQAEPGRAHALAARRTSRPRADLHLHPRRGSTTGPEEAPPDGALDLDHVAGLPPHGGAPDTRHPRGALERVDTLPGLVALGSPHDHPERAQHVPAGKDDLLGGRGHAAHQTDDVDVLLTAGRRTGH